ncbi:unnamed protein product [Owenia fusiformis]|uniref:Uncharacterized protein n=1 Tax=Owenia fusiformis TaxID=6347 RepID=A0A8J1Y804_OWEFU|nr:unnamed protein product [Owenia fusiformis]
MSTTEQLEMGAQCSGTKEKKSDPFAEELVERKLMRSGRISHAIVINAINCDVRANQPITFKPLRSTRESLVKLIKGDRDALNPDGIDLGTGSLYMPGKLQENRALFATDGRTGGFTAFLVKGIVILGVYDHDVAAAVRLVTEVADYVDELEETH